jgi:hypothetical protein
MRFYGFWLPNDQRGSGSDWVRSKNLLKYAPANPNPDNRSVAAKPFDPEIRRLARSELLYPYVELNGEQARSVAVGFRNEISAYGGAIHALRFFRAIRIWSFRRIDMTSAVMPGD